MLRPSLAPSLGDEHKLLRQNQRVGSEVEATELVTCLAKYVAITFSVWPKPSTILS